MPSLKNLDTFAGLFRSIGGEADILAERGQEPNVLALPDSEPESLPAESGFPAASDEPLYENDVPEKDTGVAEIPFATPQESPTNLPSDSSVIPDAVFDDAASFEGDDEGAGIAPDFHFDDYAQPADEDLSPISPDIAFPEGFGGDAATEESDTSSEPNNLDLGTFDDLFESGPDAKSTVPEGNAAADNPDNILASLIGDNAAAESPFPEGVLDDLGLSDSFDDPSLFTDNANEPADRGPTRDSDETREPSAFDAPGINESNAATAEPPVSDDSFDRFDLAEGSEPHKDKAGASTDFSGLDEFVIPSIEVPSEGAASSETAQTGMPRDRKDESVNFTEDELSKLEETLQSYPLNLRVACEEAIVESNVPQTQLLPLVRLLMRGGSARDVAKLAGKILDKDIVIPHGYQKQTGAELEEEQSSFGYIFVKKFLPMLVLFLFIGGVLAGAVFLGWTFIYKPWKADSLYKAGIERIAAGEYERANERFNEAWRWKPKKDWFYTYAETFRDARQYFYAEEKYEQLIAYTAMRNKNGVPEKKSVLDYALMETDYLHDYEKADRIIRRHILDWNPDDAEGLLALGDVNMAWGDANVEFSDENETNRDGGKYEVARENYARHLEVYGWADPVLERMLIYFIRADDLSEILPLQDYFMSKKNLTIRPSTLAELGAYLLDKQIEETRYVRAAEIEEIEGVRDILLRAAEADPSLPEPHYHLARYYAMLGERSRERQYLDNASRLFDSSREESARRVRARIDTEQRTASLNRDRREFFAAEERLVKAANLYEDAVERRIFRPSSRFGSIYAGLGDLAYFTKFANDSQAGNWQEAVTYYLRAEESGYSTAKMQYRLGSSYYHLTDYQRAEERFFETTIETPPGRRVLNALGNVSFLRGNLSAAESYFSQLVSMLQDDRLRIADFRVDDVAEHRDLIERLMIAQNNLGAVYQTLAERNGSNRDRTRALALYSDASRIWDNLVRDPQTFTRPGLAELSTPSVSLSYLNIGSTLYPVPDTRAEIYIGIDRDMLEPSPWEDLTASESVSGGLPLR
jgi:tetratricopeptide (TPR) repeat protein